MKKALMLLVIAVCLLTFASCAKPPLDIPVGYWVSQDGLDLVINIINPEDGLSSGSYDKFGQMHTYEICVLFSKNNTRIQIVDRLVYDKLIAQNKYKEGKPVATVNTFFDGTWEIKDGELIIHLKPSRFIKEGEKVSELTFQ